MFDSEIKASALIDELKNTEVDIALDIPNRTYVDWLNSLQQLLYTEVIKEQKAVGFFNNIGTSPSYGVETVKTFPLSQIATGKGDDESEPRFEDIHAIYISGVQLIKSTVTSGAIFSNTFFKYDNAIGYNAEQPKGFVRVIYFVRPALIDVDDNDKIDNSNVMIPVEFIDLVKAKLRGEAYKLVNEDGIAAKWLNDYNVLLETFKAWIATRSPNFGI